MFAPEVVDERLDRFEKEFKWRPIPHEISEVDQWTARLSNAFEVDQKGNIYQVRGLTKQERHFIANERAMCVASCQYFLTRYYYIKAHNRIIRFTFRQGQWILWQMLCYLDRMGDVKDAASSEGPPAWYLDSWRKASDAGRRCLFPA